MKKRRLLQTVIASIALIGLATPAVAAVTIQDDLYDVYDAWSSGVVTYSTSNLGDITSATVDYTDQRLNVRINYAYLGYSIDTFIVSIDTNADNQYDFLLGTVESGTPLLVSPNSSAPVAYPSFTTIRGTNGWAEFTVGAGYLGSPANLSIQALSSNRLSTGANFDLDAVPSVGFSQQIPIQRTAVVTPAPAVEATPAPAAEAKANTKTTVKLSKSSQRYKKSPAKLTVGVSPKLAGKAVIYDGKKKLKTVSVKNGKATYKFSKTLKRGTHKIKVVFKPSDTKKYKSSTSKTVKLKVKK